MLTLSNLMVVDILDAVARSLAPAGFSEDCEIGPMGSFWLRGSMRLIAQGHARNRDIRRAADVGCHAAPRARKDASLV